MKTLITLLTAVTLVFGASAQKRTLDLGSFSEVSFGTAGTLYITQGSNESVEVRCSDELFDKLEFEVTGDRLAIRKKSRWDWGSLGGTLDVYITMKEVEGLSVSGSGDIIGQNQIDADELKLRVSGSGDIELEADASELDIRISGSGGMELKGTADEAEVKISGSGKVRADDMEVKIFKASISGSGRCYITATEEINASISGSGSVYYSGDPDRVISNSSGSGKVRKM